ncbi:O-antigen ligase family protein [Allomuricauda sp. d1]|uniref:O-antigen ligase family protein n=1 Tax=Allomuricauda sp. d1 TaxID=3136725 RepID=UPI0031D40BE5
MKVWRTINQYLLMGSLLLVVITLPFPNYNFNSYAIICSFSAWLSIGSWQQKWEYLRERKYAFIILSSLFWMAVAGVFYSNDVTEATNKVVEMLPFLIFPLIFCSIEVRQPHKETLLQHFGFSVCMASVFALVKATYFKVYNLGDFFYFDQLKRLLEKHTTYFALFWVVVIVYFLHDTLLERKKIEKRNIAVICFGIIMLYLLSVRISVVALGAVCILFLFSLWKKMNTAKRAILIAALVLASTAYLTPNFQKRFQGNDPERVQIDDIGARSTHWKAVMETISQQGILFGAGTGDGHQGLYDNYLVYGFESGHKYKYNAHNQYLESMLYHGTLGLFVLLLTFAFIVVKGFQKKDTFALAIALVCLLFMSTESILVRHSGIVLTSFLLALIAPILIEQKP